MGLKLKKINHIKREGKYIYTFEDKDIGTVIGMMDIYHRKGHLQCAGGGDNYPLPTWLEIRREGGIKLTFYEIVAV